MLKIKLARFGKKKQPHYRIVINEARDKRDGQYVDVVGQYVPTLQPKILKVEMDKYNEWLKKGAQPTDTVRALVARFQSGTPFPARKPNISKKAKAKAAAAETAAQEAKVATPEVVAETPAEEKAAAAETPAAEPETKA